MSLLRFLNTKKYVPKILEISNVSDSESNFIRDIFDNKIDLILVRNAISADIIKELVSQIEKIPSELSFPTPFGSIHGKTMIGSNDDMNLYSEIGIRLNKFLLDETGFDLNTILAESISNLTNNTMSVKIPIVNQIPYAGYTAKVLEPNKGGIHVHIGSEFLKLLPECVELSKIIKDKHQISFFYVLQEPEKGGELTLFDVDWKSSPPEFLNENNFQSHEERERFFKNRKKHSIPPKAGDLIVFNGGNVWHKVENIIGSRNRITLGGFIGISNNDEDVLYWN